MIQRANMLERLKNRTALFLITLVVVAVGGCARHQTPSGLSSADLSASGLSDARLARLDTTLNQYVDKKQLPGGVLLVARHGEMAYHKAFGWQDKEAKIPMQKDSLFRIASQTKALTSVAIMVLQERGQLLISDPVSKYLPEFARTTVAEKTEGETGKGYKVVPAKRQITLRDLLTHSAGIGYGSGLAAEEWKKAGIFGWYLADKREPLRDIVARMATLPQVAQPGESFVYGYNTDILGVVVEVITGQTLGDFLKENIFDPLAMKDSFFYVPTDKARRLSVVYSSGKSGIERAANPGKRVGPSHIGQGHYVTGPRQAHAGGAGMVSTAADYGRFLQMLLNGGHLDGVRVLSRKSVELMTVDHLGHLENALVLSWVGDGIGFGLGFTVLEDLGAFGALGTVGEYGWGGAYHSRYWVDPKEDMLVVYMTQLILAIDIDDIGKIRALIYQAIEE